MSIDNTGGETPTNEVLVDGDANKDAIVAALEQQLQQAKAEAAEKAEQARKANYKIEADEKFTKALEGLRSELDAKVTGLTTVLGTQLAAKDAEIDELKSIVSAKKGQTPEVSSIPVDVQQDVASASQGKYDGMFGVIRNK